MFTRLITKLFANKKGLRHVIPFPVPARHQSVTSSNLTPCYTRRKACRVSIYIQRIGGLYFCHLLVV